VSDAELGLGQTAAFPLGDEAGPVIGARFGDRHELLSPRRIDRSSNDREGSACFKDVLHRTLTAWWREGLAQIGGVVALIVVVGGLSAASNYLQWQAERRLAALLAASGTHGWRQVAVVIDGVSVPLARPTHLVVTDEGYTILVGGKTYQKGTTKMPDRDRPWETDVTVTEGASAGETIRQISKVEGDLLIACNAGGADRPTEFSSREGTGHLLSVWIRVE
jgi:uncharacterized protein (TIGR03067 family)